MRVNYNPAELIEQPVEGTNLSRLMRSFTFSLNDDPYYVLPEGMESDGSSVPFFARWVIDRRKMRISGWIHDYMYRTGIYDRKTADEVWRVVSETGREGQRTNRFQSALGYYGLRIGGWIAYKTAARKRRHEVDR